MDSLCPACLASPSPSLERWRYKVTAPGQQCVYCGVVETDGAVSIQGVVAGYQAWACNTPVGTIHRTIQGVVAEMRAISPGIRCYRNSKLVRYKETESPLVLEMKRAMWGGDRQALAGLIDAYEEGPEKHKKRALPWRWLHENGKWPSGPLMLPKHKSAFWPAPRKQWDWWAENAMYEWTDEIPEHALLPSHIYHRLHKNTFLTLRAALEEMVRAIMRKNVDCVRGEDGGWVQSATAR